MESGLTKEQEAEMVEIMTSGFFDQYCKLKIGDRVKKCNSEEGDRTPDGEEGRIVGNISTKALQKDIAPEETLDGYLVIFDVDVTEEKESVIFLVESKLEKI